MSETNNIKYVDVVKAFEPNPDMEVEGFITKNGMPLVQIKNFYKNPDMVRDILINTPVSSTSAFGGGGFAGRRGHMHNFIDSPQFYPILNAKLSEFLSVDWLTKPGSLLHGNGEFLFNVFDSDENLSNSNAFTLPHSDPGLIASILYLNKEDEEPIGTAVYQVKETGASCIPNTNEQYTWYQKWSGKSIEEIDKEIQTYREIVESRDINAGYILDDNDEDFEIIFKSTGEYNSLVAYVGCTLHSPLMDYSLFKNKEYKRINQVIFLHDWNDENSSDL